MNSARVGDYARGQEIKLILSLLASSDTDGVIGKLAKKALKRLPSNIYCEGLRAWGILMTQFNQPDYHRNPDDFYARQTGLETDDEGGGP